MTATASPLSDELSDELDALIAEETRSFVARQPQSRAHRDRAAHLAGGATSNWQIAEPQAVWFSHGSGSKIYDVDGIEYADFHGGYGVSLAGHGHPAIVAAVQERVTRGTHFAQPTEDAIVVADNLAERFDQPLWRFANSGTEATMDAIHLMRAATGRDRILKVEGCYHGHHDSVEVSVLPEPDDDIGPPDRPHGVADNSGIPDAILDLVTIVPFNDLGAVERALAEHPDQVAGMILEPVMMNAGIIDPVDGYLAGLKELLHRHGALLTFDEVKTGLTVGPGGVTRLVGVTPDLVCLAKAIGGGVSTAAIGGTEEVMSLIADGRYEQVGTFNGNPLAMAAARAMLTEVLTPASYAHLDRLRDRMTVGLQDVIDRHDLPWRVVTAGAKGCVSFLPHPIRNFRDFLQLDGRYGQAHWLVQANRGAFLPPWGKVEQWLVSVQHTDEDIDRFVANCGHLASRLTAPAAR
ncbi:aspartate aminotransferase family protein [Nocardioides guangzhouensis]|uniref:Aspartate aminotransferase family protein n=1 Tax=Nocardioides guangzhouensis TaxID=2497878 RepID=A0A4Q4ZJP0_9ACTN|nr:aspartate aminotransferase family protein [Nocardioides guangzhouensis]RYP88055.1 aspartate aminotransferase family protein [Nocardioides guangzhouensis]